MSFYESRSADFDSYVLGNAPVKQLATGFDWVEGPVWFGDAGCLLFSDIPERSHHALDSGHWRHHLPTTVELQQRSYARPRGSAGLVRTRHPTGDTDRT